MQEWIVTLEKDEDGWYVVEYPAIPGVSRRDERRRKRGKTSEMPSMNV